jgi:large subunit ribosomal protein L29
MALKAKQLREESTARLREMLVETQEQLFRHKMRIASGEGVNPHEARTLRRDIARIRTLLRAVGLVAERAGVDEEVARASLDRTGWNLQSAARAAKAASGPAD